MTSTYILSILASCFFVGIFSKVLESLLGIEERKIYNRRMKQLKKIQENSKRERTTKDWANMVTSPGEKVFSRWFSKEKIEQVERDLVYAEWDRFFTGSQYIALHGTCIIFGIIIFFINSERSLTSVVIPLIMCIAPKLLLENQKKETQKEIINGFPEFADLIESYLAGNIIFIKSIEKSVPYLNKAWKKLATNLILDTRERGNLGEAIEYLISRVESSAIKDFFMLLKLAKEQGVMDELECFEEQGELISNLLEDKILNTIEDKNMWTTVIQLPLLIANIIVLGAYYLSQVTTLFKVL